MITMKEFEKTTGIRFNSNMSGKMAGITCLSTSVLCNPFCAARREKEGCICSRCYAASTCSRYSALEKNMQRNSELLTSQLFDLDQLPVINAMIFRFEAFGDLINSTQCRNYFRLAKRNPGVRFALWTKNPGIVQQAIDAGEAKPDNLVILLSSAMIGQRADASRWSFVDKTFTVYAKDQLDDSEINCGSRACLTCQRCYRKDTTDDIRERLK